MTNRRSYRGLMGMPAWRLYGRGGAIVASCRAATLKEARELFARHGFVGARIRKGKHGS